MKIDDLGALAWNLVDGPAAREIHTMTVGAYLYRRFGVFLKQSIAKVGVAVKTNPLGDTGDQPRSKTS